MISRDSCLALGLALLATSAAMPAVVAETPLAGDRGRIVAVLPAETCGSHKRYLIEREVAQQLRTLGLTVLPAETVRSHLLSLPATMKGRPVFDRFERIGVDLVVAPRIVHLHTELTGTGQLPTYYDEYGVDIGVSHEVEVSVHVFALPSGRLVSAEEAARISRRVNVERVARSMLTTLVAEAFANDVEPPEPKPGRKTLEGLLVEARRNAGFCREGYSRHVAGSAAERPPEVRGAHASFPVVALAPLVGPATLERTRIESVLARELRGLGDTVIRFDDPLTPSLPESSGEQLANLRSAAASRGATVLAIATIHEADRNPRREGPLVVGELRLVRVSDGQESLRLADRQSGKQLSSTTGVARRLMRELVRTAVEIEELRGMKREVAQVSP